MTRVERRWIDTGSGPGAMVDVEVYDDAEETDRPTPGEDDHLTTPSGLAHLALLQHTQGCEQCTDDPTECGTGRALVRTVREARRVESAATARVRDVHG